MEFNDVSGIKKYTLDNVIKKIERVRNLYLSGVKNAFNNAKRELSNTECALEDLVSYTTDTTIVKPDILAVQNVQNCIILARGLRDIEGVKTISASEDQDIQQFLIDYAEDKHPDLFKELELKVEDGTLKSSRSTWQLPAKNKLTK